jgi:hypothetical protein
MRRAWLLVALAGCAPHPLATDLYGLWSNIDDTATVRVLEFKPPGQDPDIAGSSDVYHIYNYPQGSEATEVQRGTYEIARGDGWELVTTSLWDPSGVTVGESFGNPIRGFDDDALTLELEDGSERDYSSTETMP